MCTYILRRDIIHLVLIYKCTVAYDTLSIKVVTIYSTFHNLDKTTAGTQRVLRRRPRPP